MKSRLARSLRRSGPTPEELFRRGLALQADGHDGRALPFLVRAAMLHRTDADAWLQAYMALSAVGRSDDARLASSVLIELHPVQKQMWFEQEIDDSLEPLARVSRTAFISLVPRDAEALELQLQQVISDLRASTEPPVRRMVGFARLGLAGQRAVNGRVPEALQILDEMIDELAADPDPRVRSCVASALVTRGGLLDRSGQAASALLDWARVRSVYGEDAGEVQELVARAIGNTIDSLHVGSPDRDALLLEFFNRYRTSADVSLRRRSAAALQEVAGQDLAAEAFRDDPDWQLARMCARARVDRWVRRRLPLGRILARGLGPLAGLIIALRHRRRATLVDTAVGPRRRAAGAVLVVLGRSVQLAAILAAAYVNVHAVVNEQTADLRLVGCVLILGVARLAALLGHQLSGRFTVETLGLAPRRLPRTVLTLALTLVSAWLAPGLEQVGLQFTYGPVRATFDWLKGVGLPTWADIVVMIPIAPVEVLFMITIFSAFVLRPLGAILGKGSAAVSVLEESFGSLTSEPDGDPAVTPRW